MDAEERAEAAAMAEMAHQDDVQRALDPLANRWKATDLPNLRGSSPKIDENHGACRALEESIKDSYYKARKTVNQQRRTNSEIYESIIRSPKVAMSKANHKTDPFFKALEESSVYLPKGESSLRAGGSAYGGGADRFESEALGETYAAPATSNPLDRPYYSRRTTGDPDYFDYDLEASVNQFKQQTRPFVPPSHDLKDIKAVNSLARTSGMESLSSRMFQDQTNPSSSTADPRYHNSSYLSCALRTPDFWTRRFENLLSDGSSDSAKYKEYSKQSQYKPRRYAWERDAEDDNRGGRECSPPIGGSDDEDIDDFPPLRPSASSAVAASAAIAKLATDEMPLMARLSMMSDEPPPHEPLIA